MKRSKPFLFLIAIAVLFGITALSIGLYNAGRASETVAEVKVPSLFESRETIRELFERGSLGEAAQLAQKLHQEMHDVDSLKITEATALLQMGSTMFREKSFSESALGILNAVVERNPENAEAYRVRGYAHEIREEYAKAMADYNLAAGLDPQSADIFNSRGHALDLQGQLVEAEQDYRQALKLNPKHGLALLNMARISLRRRDFEEAARYASSAVQSTNDVNIKGSAKVALGYALLGLKKLDQSLIEMNQAVEILPELPATYLGRAQVNFASLKGERDRVTIKSRLLKVMRDTEKAVKINKNQSLAYLFAARSLLVLGRMDEAKKLYAVGSRRIDTDLSLTRPEKGLARKMFEQELSLVS